LGSDIKMEEIEKKIDESVSLGKQGSFLMDQLSKKAIYQPDIDHAYKLNKGEKLKRLDRIKEFKEKNIYPLYVLERLDQLGRIKKLTKKDKLREGKFKNEKIQLKTIKTRQEGSNNYIIEKLDNRIYGNYSVLHSDLFFVNSKTGEELDMNMLLPDNSHFLIFGKHFFEDKDDENVESKKMNLKDYAGTKNSNVSFAAYNTKAGNSDRVCVKYGDLSKKGGMLSLLHEIAHAWHTKHRSKYGRGEFDDMIFKLRLFLETRISSDRLKDDMDQALENFFEVKTDDIKYTSREDIDLSDGEVLVKLENGQNAIIRSEKVIDIVKCYEKEERDAWAHAIKLLRFYRKKGIDLEPQLDTKEDTRDYIEKRLKTYEDAVSSDIEISGNRKLFTGNKKDD